MKVKSFGNFQIGFINGEDESSLSIKDCFKFCAVIISRATENEK